MKKLLMLMLMLLCGVASAESRNPDRFTSLGLDYQENRDQVQYGIQEFFDPKDQTTTFAASQSAVIARRVTMDLRFPISDFVTVNVRGGPSRLTSFGVSNTGYMIGTGVRVYFPGLTNSWK